MVPVLAKCLLPMGGLVYIRFMENRWRSFHRGLRLMKYLK